MQGSRYGASGALYPPALLQFVALLTHVPTSPKHDEVV